MSTVASVLYTLAFNVVGILAPLVTYPYVSRVLGPEKLGLIGAAGGLANYFLAFAGLGLVPYGVRAVAVAREDRAKLRTTATELFLLQSGASLFAYGAFIALTLSAPAYSGEALLFAVVGAPIALGALSLDWLFQGLGEFKFLGLRNTAFQAASVLALFVVVRGEGDYVAYAAIASAAALALGAVSLPRALSRASLGGRELRPARHLTGIASFTGINVLIAAYTNADFVALGLLSSPAEAGYYTIPIRLARLTAVLGASLSTVLLPKLASLASAGAAEEEKRTLRRSSSFLALFSLPAAAGILATAEELVAIFGGAGYEPAVATLRFAALLVPLIAATNFLQMQVLVPRGKETGLAKAFGAGLAVAALGNLLLVPRFGRNGAMAATIAAEAAVLFMELRAAGLKTVAPLLDGRAILRYAAGALLAGAAAWGVTRAVASAAAGFAAAVPAAAALYAIFLLALGDAEAREIAGLAAKMTAKRKSR